MNEKDILTLLNTVPFGIISFEASGAPKITGISDRMLEILRFSPADDLQITKQSIYILIPPEDRRRFELYLGRVERHKTPISAEMDLLRFDNTRAHCFAWITRPEDSEGFQLICIDITDWHRIQKEQETRRYIKVLSSVYDDIFEFDYAAHTVKCVYSRRSAMLRWVRNVPMDMTDATNRWILKKVPAEEREKLRSFFAQGNARTPQPSETPGQHEESAGRPGQDPANIRYSVLSSDGTIWQYKGAFIENGPLNYLFCCRKAYEEMPSASHSWSGNGPKITIRTFGYFDVFVDGKPIAFRNEKSKELFALLVDRRGGYVSSEDAITFLWEDAPADTVTLARYRKVAMRLKNTLEEYGISDAVESVNGKRRIVPERVQCDLFQYLSGKEEYSQLFKGSYLTNYSWAETTLAELQNAGR